MSDDSGLRIEEREGVSVARMEFGRANALGPEVVETLIGGLARISGPMVITGEGRIFSAGLDLVALDELGGEEVEDFVDRFSALMIQVLTARRPVVAAVNGHAVAGGCILALACDHRVGTVGDFKIGLNELALGLTLPASALEIARAALGPQAQRRVILAADLVDPAAAVELGVLDELAADPAANLERACEVAREMGSAPQAFASVKGALVAPVAEAVKDRRKALDRRFVDIWFGEEATRRRREAVERLKQKKG